MPKTLYGVFRLLTDYGGVAVRVGASSAYAAEGAIVSPLLLLKALPDDELDVPALLHWYGEAMDTGEIAAIHLYRGNGDVVMLPSFTVIAQESKHE